MHRDLINKITSFRERVISSRDTVIGRDRDGLAVVRTGLGYHFVKEKEPEQIAEVNIEAITSEVSKSIKGEIMNILKAINELKTTAQPSVAVSGESGIINSVDLEDSAVFISSKQLGTNFSTIGEEKTGSINENELDDLFNIVNVK